MTAVRGVSKRSTSAGSTVSVCGPMSANTGVRPFQRIAFTVELNVNDGTMASPPAGRSSALRATMSPMSPDATQRTRGVPRNAWARASKSFANTPKFESMCESHTSWSSAT